MSAETEPLAVAIARVEGKLDAYAARTGVVEEKVAELDARLRGAATDSDVRSLEDRVRAQETRSVVTPAGLTVALTATVSVLGGLFALVPKFA